MSKTTTHNNKTQKIRGLKIEQFIVRHIQEEMVDYRLFSPRAVVAMGYARKSRCADQIYRHKIITQNRPILS